MKRFDPTTLEGNEARLNHGDSERVRLKEEDMSKRKKPKRKYQPDIPRPSPYDLSVPPIKRKSHDH